MVYQEPKVRLIEGYKHSSKVRRAGASWLDALLLRERPIVYINPDKWRELMILADYVTGEFSAILKMRQIDDNQWFVDDWYLPEQITTHGSVDLTRSGAMQMMRDLGDQAEHYYGCFHIHPGEGNKPPRMSNIDISTMWAWVKAAKRGVFIVANRTGAASAVLLEEKFAGIPIQLPMTVEIGWETPMERVHELRDLLDERVLYGVMEQGRWTW